MNAAKERIAAALARRYGERLAPPDVPNLDALAVLNERAVCRKYRPDPVPEAVVRLLCATALAAPTKSDLQQATLIRVADSAKRAAIAALLPGSPWLAGAPELFVFCADGWRFRRLFERRNAPFVNDHLDAFFNATVDAAIALSAFVTAAEQSGLGCCPISVIRNHAEEVSGLLKLPDHVFPIAGLGVGWPAAPHFISARLPLSLTVHRNHYTDATDAKVRAYDRRRNDIFPYRAQRNVARFGEAEEYGWSEEKARHYALPERADFGAYVKRRGFRLE